MDPQHIGIDLRGDQIYDDRSSKDLWVDVQHERKVSLCQAIDRQPLLFRWGIYIGAVLLILVFGFYGPAYNAADFIYQQF